VITVQKYDGYGILKSHSICDSICDTTKEEFILMGGHFAKDTRARAFVATVHIANMVKAGLTVEQYKNPELLANVFTTLWNDSGKDRTSGIAVCISKDGLYHAHMALYGNTTTLENVSKILYNSHIEPQLGGKKELKSYLEKSGSHSEKGEQVLYTKDLDEIQDVQGQRNDLNDIENLLELGVKPNDILESNFRYRRYEKMIKAAFLNKRIRDMPLVKDMQNEYHVGESGTGKTYTYIQLCEMNSPEDVYLITDYENGGFDFYAELGAPSIIFLDEFKGNLRFGTLLTVLDKYSRNQTHCRYGNTYNLWTKCVIASIYPPEEVYSFMVEDGRRATDSIKQLLRRLDTITYHYKKGNEYMTYSIPASEYINYEDLKQRALSDDNGFVQMSELPDYEQQGLSFQ
jgi:hypothetical protein